ncbi:prolipoprotein diacylglyceryl transferase [Spongiactinospora sp. TRM90649]|uniref:prolipoprotein diacylglyceryl transferase n=1 Tax=Spongiactinospora sp. TRM90649 TaxID=3031114 RepID=UPI0023F9FDEA|nr:prolipoprotein diacylglyceryl transferase [Spongiactinospora sp. TRM90649]MDF5755977.1 prolipoprotein diacylglyceryl transferase [Spongiactinospora sp. TRM90649]
MPLASIPSPSEGTWYLGPIPLRAYALCILLGIIVAVWMGERRWRARGGAPGTIVDLAVWAVPFGLVGGRLYHVITDYQLYFPDRPLAALYIWNGGLGIWGAIALGGVGVWIACRRRGISLSAVADTLAPCIAVAQAIGRWGNYFNQELFGSPTDLPWGLEIEPGRDGTVPGVDTYHPTFLYESLWNLVLAFVLIWAGRRFSLRHGRLFALYVAGYTLGRFWIEGLRVDEAHIILGLRLNQWTSIVLFLAALAYFWVTRNRTGEESLGEPATPDDGVDPGHQGSEADLPETSEAAGDSAEAGPGDDDDGDKRTSAEEPVPTASSAAEPADETADPAHPADNADEGEVAGRATAPADASSGATGSSTSGTSSTGSGASTGGSGRSSGGGSRGGSSGKDDSVAVGSDPETGDL